MRLGLPIVVLAALIVAGVLLATRPWAGEEATARPAEFGLCNVSVNDIPPGVEVLAFVSPIAGPEGSAWEPFKSGDLILLRVLVPVPEGQEPFVDEYGLPLPAGAVQINAMTGEVEYEDYRTPEAESKIKAVLETLKVGPWEPAGPAWPRTDTSPDSDIVELRSAEEALTVDTKPTLKYRLPEDGSGMITRRSTVSAGVGEPLMLRAFTCESIVEVHGTTGEVLQRDVVPEEEAMFQRFLDEVIVP